MAVATVALCAGWAAAPLNAAQPQITDPADDAYRYPDNPVGQPEPKPAVAALSNPAADIVSVTFGKSSPFKPGHDGGYSVSLTVKGAPHPAFNYLVGGMFADDCYLIHFLKAGETRKAMAYCSDGEESRTVAMFEGSTVAIKGNTISANFSFRRFTLPSQMKNKPELKGLYAMSCPVTSQSWGCNDDVIDWAFADATFSL